MSELPEELPVEFGSAYREGRDRLEYQQSRLRMLASVVARLADVYARQVQSVARKSAEVWRARVWLDDQRQRWQAEAERQSAANSELQERCRALEQQLSESRPGPR